MDRRLDMALALAFMVAGAIIIWQATLIRSGVVRDPLGPRAAFYFCGGIMVVGGAVIVLRHLRALREGRGILAVNEGSEDTAGYPAHLRRSAALVGACLAYALLFQPLGYILATPPFIVAALAIMAQRRWTLNVAIAVIFTAIVYVVFGMGLGVRMPHGPLTPILRDLGWITL